MAWEAFPWWGFSWACSCWKNKIRIRFHFHHGSPMLGTPSKPRHAATPWQIHSGNQQWILQPELEHQSDWSNGESTYPSKILRCEGFRQTLIVGLIKACLTPVHGPYLLGSLNFGISNKKINSTQIMLALAIGSKKWCRPLLGESAKSSTHQFFCRQWRPRPNGPKCKI